MPPAESLRELVASSAARWSTLEVEGRTWQDRLAQREAAGALPLDPTLLVARSGFEGATSPNGQREQSWHLWSAGNGRVRSDYLIGRELVSVVGVGDRWWRTSDTLGTTSGGGAGRPVRLMLGPPAILLAAGELFDQLELVEIGEGAAANRPAVIFRGRPGTGRARGRALLRDAGSGAEEYEVAVDAERGVLLSLAALRAGRAFQVLAVTTVRYDHPLGPELFAVAGEVAPHEAAPRTEGRWSAESVATQIDFDLLLPGVELSPLAPHVTLSEADRRGPCHVTLTYVVVDADLGRGQLRVTEAASELPRSRVEEWRELGDYEVCEERHGRVERRRVRARRLGVHVELESAVLSLARLVEVLGALAPAR